MGLVTATSWSQSASACRQMADRLLLDRLVARQAIGRQRDRAAQLLRQVRAEEAHASTSATSYRSEALSAVSIFRTRPIAS